MKRQGMTKGNDNDDNAYVCCMIKTAIIAVTMQQIKRTENRGRKGKIYFMNLCVRHCWPIWQGIKLAGLVHPALPLQAYKL